MHLKSCLCCCTGSCLLTSPLAPSHSISSLLSIQVVVVLCTGLYQCCWKCPGLWVLPSKFLLTAFPLLSCQISQANLDTSSLNPFINVKITAFDGLFKYLLFLLFHLLLLSLLLLSASLLVCPCVCIWKS